MKKYLKFPLYMAFTAMIGMSVTACSDDDNPENQTRKKPEGFPFRSKR